MVKWNASKEDYAKAQLIAQRALGILVENGEGGSTIDIEMDVIACHMNGNLLDLDKLLAFDDPNFGHDVFGITRYIDRNTGKLTECFVPRCSV